MANNKAISPREVVKYRKESIPNVVLEAFNALIKEKFNGYSAVVFQDDVVEILEEKKYDIITRIYHHNPSIILAVSETLEGINCPNANKLGFEITRRPSGGSAIIATPSLALCYSIFISLDLFETTDINKLYKKIEDSTFYNIRNFTYQTSDIYSQKCKCLSRL